MTQRFWPLTFLSLVLPFGCVKKNHDRNWHTYRPQPLNQGMVTTSFHLLVQEGTSHETNIALDLHLPRVIPKGGVPTILRATRYARDIKLLGIIRPFYRLEKKRIVDFFVKHGYAWVDVDARGSGASFGKKIGPADPLEIKDYLEVVQWILKEDWSNKKIGTTGISYAGTTAEMLLANDPITVEGRPAVLAVAPRFSYFDAGLDIARPGGIHLESFTEKWSKVNAALDCNDLDSLAEKWYEKAMVVGIKPVDKDRDGSLLEAATKEHKDNWDPFESAKMQRFPYGPWPEDWTLTSKNFSPIGHLPTISAWGATFYSYGGWYDGAYAKAVIHRWLTLKSMNQHPHKMVLGPWNHSGNCNISPFRKGKKASFDHCQELLRFFDFHLKDRKETGIGDEAPIRYYIMGAERWEATQDWPPFQDTRTYYFRKGHKLTQEVPAAQDSEHHPVNLDVGSGTTSRWETLVGRSDVVYGNRASKGKRLLTYTSQALKGAYEVTGHPIVTLHVTSSDKEGHFFVYLEDVAPDGTVTYVTEGMLDAIHRSVSQASPPYERLGPYLTFEEQDAKEMDPGAVELVTFDLLPISYLFQKGHKLRVSLAGADIDHFESVNQAPLTWQMYYGGDRASQIIIPMRPYPYKEN